MATEMEDARALLAKMEAEEREALEAAKKLQDKMQLSAKNCWKSCVKKTWRMSRRSARCTASQPLT